LTSRRTKGTYVPNSIKGGDLLAVINLRDVPDDVYRQAKIKAATMGITLKELVIRAITEYVKKK